MSAALIVIAGACAGRVRPAHPSPPASFVATAYCTGVVTAAGTRVREGVVAADPSVLPLGTVIRLSGLTGHYNRVYTVLDTGRSVQGHRIDVYVDDCHEAVRFGRRSALVSVVRRAPTLTR